MECYFTTLIFIIVLASPLAKATNLVQDTCIKLSKSDPKNIKYDFCVQTFESDPRSSKASIDEIIEISFNITSTKAKSISLIIEQLLKEPRFDPFAKSCLETCSSLYSDAPDDLEAGLEALKAGDFESANVQVSAALDSGTTCEDSFAENPGEVSPLTKENRQFFQFAVISLAFTVVKIT